MQIGHRQSIDFDFFFNKEFDPEELFRELSLVFKLTNVSISKGTLNCKIKNIKFQFLHYPYNILEKFKNWQGLNISSIVDISCTKLITISSRGSKKDFIDLYFILQKFDFSELFAKMNKKYKKVDFNKSHILKSLTFFDEAEGQPMPKMYKNISWDKIKKEISSKASEFVKTL